MSSFEGENIQTQYDVLSYGFTYIFMTISTQQKLMKMGTATEILTTKLKGKKQQNKNLVEMFIRIHPDKEDFDIFQAVHEIFRHIKQSAKKSLINKKPRRLLRLEFKSDNITKSKTVKYLVKKILPDYK